MFSKYPIIKNKAFFKTLKKFISANNEDICQPLVTIQTKNWPVTFFYLGMYLPKDGTNQPPKAGCD